MKNGLLIGRERFILVMGVGLVVLTLLSACGQKDQDDANTTLKTRALLPDSELNEAVGDSDSTLAVDQAPGTGTLPEVEGVTGGPTGGKQAFPVAGTELKAAPKDTEVARAPDLSRPATSVSTGESGFSLQLGSFTNLANARKQVDRISALGYNPVIEESNLGGQTYHRVMLRSVGDMAEASRLGEYIHSELGIAYLVRRGE